MFTDLFNIRLLIRSAGRDGFASGAYPTFALRRIFGSFDHANGAINFAAVNFCAA